MTDVSKPISSQMNIRVAEEDQERWKRAAETRGLTVSEFIRKSANDAATAILDCPHVNQKKYPWSLICMDCGKHLEG